MADLIVCVATRLEGEHLPSSVGGTSIEVLTTGIGPVNAAFALTRRLAVRPPRAVMICGVGGAYPGAGIEPGDVMSAETETYGDLGAGSPEGFLDMGALGLPVIDGDPPVYNRLALDLFPTDRRAAFVTCSTCTGTDEAARAIVSRTGGVVESMEGAALVHVARLSGLPVGEVRGISNLAGRRDRASWRLGEAAARARHALIAWIEAGGC